MCGEVVESECELGSDSDRRQTWRPYGQTACLLVVDLRSIILVQSSYLALSINTLPPVSLYTLNLKPTSSR